MNYIAFMISYKISNVAEIAVILSIGLIRGEFRVIYAETTGAGDLNAAFRHLWTDRSPAWTGGFLDDWFQRAMRSRLERLKKVARMLRSPA